MIIKSVKKPEFDKTRFCDLGLAVINTELAAIETLKQRIDEHFSHACHYLLQCQGRIVVTGMGKSGHIARKIAATLASTGSPAFYLHPAEAGHGDFGMITRQDVIIALSNSGNTPEIMTLIPLIKRMAIPLISLTGDLHSDIAKQATINLDVSIEKEACPLGLAPTASTTAALVMGDALAVALLEARGFTEQDFAFSHPSGALGKRLLLQAADVMRQGNAIPVVFTQTKLAQALLEISQKALGMTTVVDSQHRLLGIFTDGDLRRSLDKGVNVHETVIDDCMTKHAKMIHRHTLAIDALNLMETHKITTLLVSDDQEHVDGVIHLHDLLQAGVV